MRLGLVCTPLDEINLALAKQISCQVMQLSETCEHPQSFPNDFQNHVYMCDALSLRIGHSILQHGYNAPVCRGSYGCP